MIAKEDLHDPDENKVATLFRPEVMASRNQRWMGEVLQISPLPVRFIAVTSLVIVAALILFLFFGKFTKYARVTGILEPDTGLITIQSPLQGIIIAKEVQEGQHVRSGDVLFRVSTDISVAAEVSSHAKNTEGLPNGLIESGKEMLASIDRQSETYRKERAELTDLLSSQRKELDHSIEGLNRQLLNVEAQLQNQRERLDSSKKIYDRYKTLMDHGYISDLGLEQKHDDLYDQTSKYHALQDSKILLEKDIQAAKDNIKRLAIQSEQEDTRIERSEQELVAASIKGQAAREILIKAPQDGIVSTVMVELGQLVKVQTLLTIIPENSNLEAHLFVKAQDIGFIEGGQQVHIRYQAFPHERFGQFEGEIYNVSQTSIPPQEVPQILAKSNEVSEGVYRVKVKLDDQAIRSRGKIQPLVSGMQLEADVVQDSKTILEWLFDPIRARNR